MHNNSSLREDHDLIREKVGFYDFTLECAGQLRVQSAPGGVRPGRQIVEGFAQGSCLLDARPTGEFEAKPHV